MDATSASFLDRLRQARDPDDWAKFVSIYEPFIRRFIRLDAELASDADDICQDVIRKVVQHLPRFERIRDGSLRAWLKTITVNEVNGYWRRRNRANRQNGSPSSILNSLADPSHDLSRRWDREYATHVVRQLQDLVAAEFSTTTWQAFRLRVLEGRTPDETAALLGISRNAVDIAKSRVLTRLRQEAAGFLD